MTTIARLLQRRWPRSAIHMSLRFVAVSILWLTTALPAQAAVRVTFWSHELGSSFPHAFVTLRGVPDAGGPPVDRNFGFTAKTVTPALLFKSVSGKLDIATPNYITSSTPQFSLQISDNQFVAIIALAAAWDDHGTDSIYDLKNHNCIHFVKEIARLAGLQSLDYPKLMKRPRSYLKAVAAANVAAVVVLDDQKRDYPFALRSRQLKGALPNPPALPAAVEPSR